jgi:hypothetical protein
MIHQVLKSLAMKKLTIVLAVLLIGLSSFAGNIDEKLIRSFNASFPNAVSVTWTESTDSYAVSFFENGIRSRVIYQKDGSFVHFTRYYQEENLPYAIRFKVTKLYPERKIFGVVEVSTVSDVESNVLVEYYVKMEDAKSFVEVKVDSDGALQVVDRFRKAL